MPGTVPLKHSLLMCFCFWKMYATSDGSTWPSVSGKPVLKHFKHSHHMQHVKGLKPFTNGFLPPSLPPSLPLPPPPSLSS